MHGLHTKPLLNFVAPLLLFCLSTVLTQNTSCNLYNDNGGGINITETQATPLEGVKGRAYKLFCHADNYCQIDWFRDGIPRDGFPYPWNFSTDYQLSLMALEDDNQTLHFNSLTSCEASTDWMCVVKGEVKSLDYTMEVTIIEPPYEGVPVIEASNDCFNKSSNFGEEVTLFCSCTAGTATPKLKIEWFKWVDASNKADDIEDDVGDDEDIDGDDDTADNEDDANNSGQWVLVLELGENGTTYTLSQPHVEFEEYCEKTDKNKQPTISQYLIINKLSEEELGIYRLVATRTDESEYKGINSSQIIHITKYVPSGSILDNSIAVAIGASVAGLTLSVVVITLLWHRKGVDVKLWYKDRYGKVESGDGKLYDVYIGYSDKDVEFVLDTLMPALQEAGYVLFIRDIDAIPGGTLVEQLISSLESSRRCILVVSQDFIEAKHAALQVEVATDQMLRHQSKIMPLLFKSVKRKAIKELRGLDRLLTVLRALRWNDNKDANNEKMIKQLLYRMPPVNRSGRSDANLPLSSRLPHGEQSNHSSQQSLIFNEKRDALQTNGLDENAPTDNDVLHNDQITCKTGIR